MSEDPEYYKRQTRSNSDGTPLFTKDLDKEHEEEVAQIIGRAWRCQVHEYGRLAPIDYYAERDGRLVGLLELKSRTHVHDKYPTVFLNSRKWLVLTMASLGMAVPGIFVVRFIDGLYWIPIAQVDARNITMGGTKKIVKSRTDIEPVIEVPIEDFEEIPRSVGK